MAYATDDDLTNRWAAASAVTLARRTLALSDAEEEIDADAFAGMTVQAHVLLTMHKLAERGFIAGGESGAVVSRSAGEISVSYAAPGDELAGGLHSSTRYGRMFDALAAKVVHPLIAV